jgi:replicative DNA helicase
VNRPATKPVEVAPPLPNDLESERIVLAALMQNHRHASEMFDTLDAKQFFDHRNGRIFKELHRLFEEGKPHDLASVVAELTDVGEDEVAGGVPYISSITDVSTVADDPAYHMDRIIRMMQLRSLAHTFEDGLRKALLRNASPSDLADTFIETVSQISRYAEQSAAKTDIEASKNLLTSFDTKTGNRRIFLGIPKVDEATCGFRDGELVIFTASPGAGKTFLALQAKREACRRGNHGLFCSAEMTAEHLIGRMLAGDSAVSYSKIRWPERMTNDEMRAIIQAAAAQCGDCRTIDGELSLPRIRMEARKMKAISVLYVDYDELVEVKGARDEWEEQRTLVRSLKSLAKELSIPVILVSQLRKPPRQDRASMPTLADLYGSGAKMKHSSFVLYVDRPFVRTLKGDETEAKIVLLKSRDGQMGIVRCWFNVKTLRFEQDVTAE